LSYVKNKDFFVGIDSDGTVFDTMSIKHTHAFIPSMIDVWNLHSIAEDVKRIAEDINLYSSTRGINRFPGLLLTFERLSSENPSFNIGDYESLRRFVESDFPMSNSGLKSYMEQNHSDFLKKVLQWSEQSDALFAKKAEGLPPFAYVKEAVNLMNKSADLMIVSAASSKGLKADWGNAGLLDKMNYVAGQEAGSKKQQINLAVSCGYDKDKCLMLGDGIGDYEAAKANGIRFYPIVPTREEQSWKELYEEIFEMFLNGKYDDEAEERLCSKLINYLEGGKYND